VEILLKEMGTPDVREGISGGNLPKENPQKKIATF